MTYRFVNPRLKAWVSTIDRIGYTLTRWRKPRPFPAVVERILLVKLTHLGDALALTPVLAQLAKRYPKARLDVLVRPTAKELMLLVPHGHTIWTMNPFEAPRGREKKVSWWRLLRTGLRLRRQRYNLVLEMRGDLRCALFCKCLGAEYLLGFSDGGGGFWYDRCLAPDPTLNFLARDAAILTLLHPPISLADPLSEAHLSIPSDAIIAVKRWLQSRELESGFVVVHTGTGRIKKDLTPQDLNRLDQRSSVLAGLPLVFTCAAGEYAKTVRFVKTWDRPYKTIILPTRSVTHLAAVVNAAQHVVSADTLTMHLAGFLKKPLTALFKGESPTIWCPYPTSTL